MDDKTRRSIQRLFIDGAADLGDAIRCLDHKKSTLEVECRRAIEVITDQLGVPEHGSSPLSAVAASYSAPEQYARAMYWSRQQLGGTINDWDEIDDEIRKEWIDRAERFLEEHGAL